MHPTGEQIQVAAYERWLNRGGVHGHDRVDWLGAEKELSFGLNYKVIVEYGLEREAARLLGDRRQPVCRLCERGGDEATFDEPRPTVPGMFDGGLLLTAEVCSECWAECLKPLDGEFRRFWEARTSLTLGAFKALVASALLIMPARELAFFPDTVEWVNNPDPSCDAGLFAESSCRVYAVAGSGRGAFVSVARRVDDDAGVPYIVTFYSDGKFVIQVDVPLCLRDEDLDGAATASSERSLVWGYGEGFCEAECSTIGLERQGNRRRAHGSGSLVRC